MKIRPVGAQPFHVDIHDEANSSLSQFCERALKVAPWLLTNINKPGNIFIVIVKRGRNTSKLTIQATYAQRHILPRSPNYFCYENASYLTLFIVVGVRVFGNNGYPLHSCLATKYFVLQLNIIKFKYVVASKCSRNHFISQKYKTVRLFKLHFVQNSPPVQL